MGPDRPIGSRYAVMLRTHVWDDFVARQYDRLVAKTGDGQVFVLLDETNGRVEVDRDNVVRYTQGDLLALGLAKAGPGNLLWYNGDYSLYVFLDRYPDFDYYIMVEYDVTVNVALDDVVAKARREGIGFIGLSKDVEPIPEWSFTETCLDAYSMEQVQKRLICLAVFSAAAARQLFDRRLELSRAHARGGMRRWPYCEAYIPTELGVSGFKMAELTEFGRADHYDWLPAIAENDINLLRDQAFVHPVLDSERYVAHTMKDTWPPESFFYPRSATRRRLTRVSPRFYGPVLARALRERIASAFRNHVLGRLPGLSASRR